VRLEATRADDRRIAIGQTKFGGAPDLAGGQAWPSWVNREGETREHAFFAQVDLGEMARTAPQSLNLPSAGLLSFFCDYSFDGLAGIMGLMPWEQLGSRVLYNPPGTNLVRRPGRLEPLPSGTLSPIPVWTWPQSPPEGVDMPDSEFDALDGVDRAYQASIGPAGSRSGNHQVGGHARYIQHPVEEEVVQALHVNDDHGQFSRERWESAKHLVPEWRVVLQIDSDPGLNLMWGDAGMLYWAARQRDIDAGAWDSGMFNFQCS
jgi:uncharacterized protein YwqG